MPIDYEDSYYDSDDFGQEAEEYIFEINDKCFKAVRYTEVNDFGQDENGFDLYDDNSNYLDSIAVESITEVKEHIELYGL